QEQSFRAGTENVLAVSAFAAAAQAGISRLAEDSSVAALRRRLETGIKTIAPEVVIVAENSPRLPNTSCILMPNVAGDTQVIHFDMAGMAVSSGSACSSGKVEVSHVLLAMGMNRAEAASA